MVDFNPTVTPDASWTSIYADLRNPGNDRALWIRRKTGAASVARTDTLSASNLWRIVGVSIAQSLVTPVTNQFIYRVRNDDGSEVLATWKGSENEDVTAMITAIQRLRYLVYASAGAPGNMDLQLEYKEPGGSWKIIEMPNLNWPFAG